MNNKIEELLKQSREQWNNFSEEYSAKLYEEFRKVGETLSKKIISASTGDKISTYRMTRLVSEISKEMAILRRKIKSVTVSTQKLSVDKGIENAILQSQIAMANRTVKVGIGTSFTEDGKVVKYDKSVEKYKDSMWYSLNTKAMKSVMAFNYGGIPFSRRVWDSIWPVERLIKNSLQEAVLLGSSAKTLASQVKELVLRRDNNVVKGGAGVYKSPYKNALRLVTTESNRAYNEGLFQYCSTKKWITGYIWRTSSGQPCEECASYEGEFFEKGSEPLIPVHPWCSCYIEIVYNKE